MQPVAQKFICWRCGTAYPQDMKFCGQCGADMHRASRLQREAPSDSRIGRATTASDTSRSRRLSDADPWIGKVIDNRYRIIGQIGQGGMGVVYKVEHQRMGKVAALKMLHAELARDPEVKERFHREAEAVSRLNHHNTVQVFDFGTTEGMLYLVMEYVKGVDIGELVDRDGPMPFATAAPLFAQTCASLLEAHEAGIVHRDLKPENIVVTRTNRGRDFVKVLDFGLAKLSEREELSDVTSRGTVVGTPYYMSPEQIRGDDIDGRSDIYALGALMYKVVTGHPPFEAKNPVGVLTKHLTDDVVPPSRRRPELKIDERIDELIGRCLEKEAADRFQSTAELAEAIEVLFSELDEASHISSRLYIGTGAAKVLARGGSSADIFDLENEDDRRLRRSDIDVFERRLLRRRYYRMVGTPLLLAAAGGAAAYWYQWSSRQPRTLEVEPNDTAESATRIALDAKVSGRIGQRLDDSHGDRDFYVVADHVVTDGTMTLTAHLSSQRNIDMRLALVDASGTPIADVNGGQVGGDEWLRRYRVTSPVRIVVDEAPGSSFPTESISERYTLEVSIAPVDERLETEPNDLGGDANPIRPGQAITGTFDSPSDVDVYRFAGPAGRYQLLISGGQGATLQVGGKPVDPGDVELDSGALIETRPGESIGDAPYTLDVVPLAKASP